MNDRVSLDDFVRLKRGYDLPERHRRDGDIPILGSFGVTGRHDKAKHPGPGVTIGRSGASIGVATYCDGPYWPLNTALYVKDFKGNDPRFVYFVLDSIDFRPHNSGAAQPSLNRNYLGAIRVWRPPLGVQKQVVRALGSIDDLIENNRRRIEVLEDMARLIYREWFVYFRSPGHQDVDLVDSDLGPIPGGWEVTSLGSVARVNGRSLRKDDDVGEILYVDIASVGPRTMAPPEAIDFAGAPGRARRLVAPGDTIWSTVRPNRRSHVLLVDPPSNLVCSTGFTVLTPKTVPSSLLFEMTSTDEFTAHLTALATGSAYPAVRPPDFECFSFALPPPELQAQFDEAVGPMHQLQDILDKQNHLLAEARDLVLPRLISGDIDVSDLDLDLEPVA